MNEIGFEICRKDLCTGCGACRNICPANAVCMRPDEKGFLHPQIGENCIHCGECVRICPQNKAPVLHKPGKVYAALAKDDDIRAASSSGGIFSLLADKVLQNGGSVFGAAVTESLTVRHIEITDAEGLERLRGSKYVQSKTRDSFQKAKERLAEGKEVLFSGTPCQIAGLYAYLGKDHENLLTVDLLCHGVPSPLVLRKFLKSEEKKKNSKLSGIYFRKKLPGWKKNFLVLTFEDAGSLKFSMYESYLAGYLKDLYLRDSCYQCSYACSGRTGDITLGDYWGYCESRPSYIEDDDLGISFVMLNTEKGEKNFRSLRRKIALAKRTAEDATRGNPILRRPNERPAASASFWNDFPNLSWEELSDIYFPKQDTQKDQISEQNREYYAIPFAKRYPRHRMYKMMHLPLSIVNRICNKCRRTMIRILSRYQRTPEILSVEETLKQIKETGNSIARFGDGEFNIIRGGAIGFQAYDQELAARLDEVLTSEIPGLEIGIPDVFGDMSLMKEEGAGYWREWLQENKYWVIKKLDKKRTYCNALISRFWTAYKYDEAFFANTLDGFRRIWEGRSLIFIEGKLTRMGVGNDLFKNAASIRRILCPAEGAWEKYDKILSEIKKVKAQYPDVLYILALGPTATVLAADMTKMGLQALDLGHLDIQYEYYLRNAESKIAISGKYVNENPEGKNVTDEIIDQAYLDSILTVIE